MVERNLLQLNLTTLHVEIVGFYALQDQSLVTHDRLIVMP